MKQTFEISAFAIIPDNKNCILLCHRRDYDLWNLPGGGMNLNETPEDCVVREVKEEVGLDVEVDYLAGVYCKRDRKNIVFSFVCKIAGGEMTLTDEADQIEYFSISKIPKNTPPRQIERIKHVLVGKSKTLIMKIQEGPSSISLIKEGKL